MAQRGMGCATLTVEEGDQLLARALGAQGEGDSRKAVDGIEAQEDIVVLYLICQHRRCAAGGWMVVVVAAVWSGRRPRTGREEGQSPPYL